MTLALCMPCVTMRGPRYATVGIDEEIGVEDSGSSSCLTAVSAPLRLLRRVCPWATPFDLVILVILLVTAAVIVTFSAVHDLHATTSEPCDPLQISKHLHCVPLNKPGTFAQVLEAQGTEREHYSVVEKQRAAQRGHKRTHASHRDTNSYEGDWIDPAVGGRMPAIIGA